MSELEKLFDAIGNRTVSINRSVVDGIWSARMCASNEQVVGLGREPAQAIRDALSKILGLAQEREREAEEHARAARDAVAHLRAAIEGK